MQTCTEGARLLPDWPATLFPPFDWLSSGRRSGGCHDFPALSENRFLTGTGAGIAGIGFMWVFTVKYRKSSIKSPGGLIFFKHF